MNAEVALKELADVLADECSKGGPPAGLFSAALDTIERRGWEPPGDRPLIDYKPEPGHVPPAEEPAWLDRVLAAIERGMAALGPQPDYRSVFYAALRGHVCAFRPRIPAVWQDGRPGLSEPFAVPALLVPYLTETMERDARRWHEESYDPDWDDQQMWLELREFGDVLLAQLRSGAEEVRVLLYEPGIEALRDEIWRCVRDYADTPAELDAAAQVLADLDRVAPVPEALVAA